LTATSGYDETDDNVVSFEDEDDALAPILVDVDTNATASIVVDVDANALAPTVVDINRGGRPKGSTNESIREHIRKKKLALNFAASEASRMKSEYRSLGFERVPKGVYKEIKKRAEDRFSLEEGSLSKGTMLSRIKRGKHLSSGKGRVSPMIALEAHFLDLILELAAMRQPVTATDALALINSMISTSDLSAAVIEWKKKHLPGSFDDDRAALLGKKYCQNFKKRHPEIKQKKAVRFDANREDWCNFDNFQYMYDHVYSAMVTSKVAIELEEEVWVKLDGTITQYEEESTGRKTKYLLTHPELVFFVDEVGSNTSQRRDGNVGGQKFVVHEAQRALLRSSYADTHFTVLGFTNAQGDPICCVIIIACAEITAKHVMGLQPWADFIGDPAINIQENSHGLDKYYPFGPTCVVNGKKIETFVTCSETGTVTSEILRDALKKIDGALTFDRTEAKPFLLLDGHGSRFQLPFLDYITAEETQWTVCIGVPYGTHVWQVGDSSEQNGAFKMALTEAKQCVLEKKMNMQLKRANIERHDIVGLVHYAWEKSFARVRNNKKATAVRGWGPLTYNLLDSEELRREKNRNPVNSAYDLCKIAGHSSGDPLALNFDNGLAGTMMDKIVDFKVRQQALETARAENAAEIIAHRREKFEKCSTLTAGVCFNSGNLCISDGQVRDRVLEELNKRKEKELASETRKKDAESHLANKVEAIHAKGLLPSQWDRKDLGTMVSWFKRPGDKALPSTKEQLLRRYYRTCSRCERERSRLKEGENSVLDDDASTGNPSDGTPGVSGSGSGNPSNGTPNLSSSGGGSGNPPLAGSGSGSGNSTLGVSGSGSGSGTPTLGVSGSGSGSGNPRNGTPNLSDSGSGSGNPMNSTVTYDLSAVEAAEAIGLLVSQRWAAGRNSASEN